MPKNPNDAPAGKGGYSGKIPAAAIAVLEWELAGIEHGTANLTLHVRDGRLARFATGRERSHMAEGCNDE
jgi:hypothetical protein